MKSYLITIIEGDQVVSRSQVQAVSIKQAVKENVDAFHLKHLDAKSFVNSKAAYLVDSNFGDKEIYFLEL